MANIFQIMSKALKNDNVTNDELKTVSPFLMCRWLAGDFRTVFVANFFNVHPDIPVQAMFKSVQAAFAGRIKYIPYPKGLSSVTEKDVEYLSKFYNIRHDLAKEYLKYISNDQMKQIRMYYTR